MQVGTPSVTTSIGAEAMKGSLNWNGFIEDDLEVFVEKAVELYSNKDSWLSAQKNGIRIINERYSELQFANNFISVVENLDLNAHRQNNFFGQILNHHTLQSTKYMSLWIEEKNKK
jgi:glycosyltransferase involved in cell wall biosynthesis